MTTSTVESHLKKADAKKNNGYGLPKERQLEIRRFFNFFSCVTMRLNPEKSCPESLKSHQT